MAQVLHWLPHSTSVEQWLSFGCDAQPTPWHCPLLISRQHKQSSAEVWLYCGHMCLSFHLCVSADHMASGHSRPCLGLI